MLEIWDDNLGAVKVLNVTDVRANFAAVLSDQSASYIITKNNHPQRVIINYTDYEKLKAYLQNDPQAAKAILPDASLSVQAPPAPVSAPKKPANGSIKGILASQIELAHSQPAKKIPHKAPPPPAPRTVSVARPASLKTYVAPPVLPTRKPAAELPSAPEPATQPREKYEPPIAASASRTQKAAARSHMPIYDDQDDYFKSSDQIETETLAERILPEPEDAYSVESADVAEEETSAEDENEVNEIEDVYAEDASGSIEKAFSIPEERKQKQNEVEETPENQDPEKQEYFNKYRKLYEPYQQSSGDRQRLVAEPAPQSPRPAARSAQPVAPSQVMATYRESPAQVVKAPPVQSTPMQAPLPKAAPPITARAPAAAPQSKPANALPSLQELLKELEQEKLSGEEGEPMNAGDIDDLILRITHD